MQIIITGEVPFIMLKDVKGGSVEDIGQGSYAFRSDNGKGGIFKQVLKQSEYDALMKVSKQGTALAAVSSKPKEEENDENSDSEVKTEEQRREELNGLNGKKLLKIADDLFDNVDRKMKKEALIDLIIDGEKDEDEPEE